MCTRYKTLERARCAGKRNRLGIRLAGDQSLKSPTVLHVVSYVAASSGALVVDPSQKTVYFWFVHACVVRESCCNSESLHGSCSSAAAAQSLRRRTSSINNDVNRVAHPREGVGGAHRDDNNVLKSTRNAFTVLKSFAAEPSCLYAGIIVTKPTLATFIDVNL